MISVDLLIQVVVSGLLAGAVYALVAAGFTLVFGVTRLVNFAHGHLVMLAMFSGLMFNRAFGLDPYVSLPLTLLLAFGIGLLLYQVLIVKLLERPLSDQMMVTLGVLIFIENLAFLLFGGELRSIRTSYTSQAFTVGGITLPVARLGAAAVSLLTIGLTAGFLKYTRAGASIRAAASNRIGAYLVGVPVKRMVGLTFAISVVLAGLAGQVMVPFSQMTPYIGAEFMLKSFVIAIIGGLGSLPGALIAGLLIGVIESLAGLLITASLGNAIAFALLMLMLLVRPQGLMGSKSWS